MGVTVRFAPSPTGRLHIGNARTALINWLFAKRHGGRFILRFDDTDAERSREEFVRAIEEDLAWLGIRPDLVFRQSRRADAYRAAAGRLKHAGRLYPCYETAEELERRRRRQLARGRPPVYDRAALRLTGAERDALEAAGRTPHWRFRLDGREVVFDDLVRGRQKIDTRALSDPVLIRADGSWLYTLPSVVDDIDHAVSHVIRGEDHVANTGPQIELFEALGAEPPVFAHHSLLTAAGGESLSKRLGALSLAALRDDGIEPAAVASLAALIGTSDPVAPHRDMDALVRLFDFAKFSRAPARFDPRELAALNARLLHETPYEEVAGRLAALGVGGGAAFWNAVRPNLARLSDAAGWWAALTGPVEPVVEDAAYLEEAARLLPEEPWDNSTWRTWTAALKERTGRGGKALFRPLRLALTARSEGPDMAAVLPVIGRARALARLCPAAARRG